MKPIAFFAFLFFCGAHAAFAVDAAALFAELPTPTVKDVDRRAAIVATSADGTHLKLTLPGDFRGEFKVLADAPKETIVAVSVFSCDASQLEVWARKSGAWREITKAATPKLGRDDVEAMLAVSPVTVEKLGGEVGVAYYFGFADDIMTLSVRRQNGCEVAGIARSYRFDGRRFVRK